jgi:hypothetical protein
LAFSAEKEKNAHLWKRLKSFLLLVKKFFGPPEGTVSYSALGKKSIPTD